MKPRRPRTARPPKPDGDSDGPRDVRRGDCWLPWHFLPPKG